MLRITEISRSSEKVALRVEGWIAGQDVQLLEDEGLLCLTSSEHLVLDLDGVQFIDRAGLVLLKDWSQKGVRLGGGSWFVRVLLATHGLQDAEE